MHTIHLTDDQVRAYLRDLSERIREMEEENQQPEVWVTIGASGSILGKRLTEVAPDLYAKADELIVAYDRRSSTVSYPKENDPGKIIAGKRVLLIDGTIHSGATVLRVVDELQKFKPAALTSYAVAVQRGAKLIPNYFGFLVGDHDRVHLPSPLFHNNRLFPFGIYRKIKPEDATRPMIETEKEFINKITWEDRLYEVATDPRRHVYLHEQADVIAGFVSFRYEDNGSILIDEVGVDKASANRGIGGHLMRWAEHCGRHTNCSHIELWAVGDRVEWYGKRGFESSAQSPFSISGHKFFKMRKKILYNLPNDDNLAMGH